MPLTISDLKEIEFAGVRVQQGGRLEYYSDSTLQWQPYYNSSIGLYTGTTWSLVTPPSTVSFVTTTSAMNGAALLSNKNYDVYARYQSAASFELCLYPWTSDTARLVTPTVFEGVYVYENSTTSGKQWRYLGTARLNSSKSFVDSESQRFIINHNNKELNYVRCWNNYGGTFSLPTTQNTWYNPSPATEVRGEFLSLTPSGGVTLYGSFNAGGMGLSTIRANWQFFTGLSLNATNTTAQYSPNNGFWQTYAAGLAGGAMGAPIIVSPGFGYNYILVLVNSNDAVANNIGLDYYSHYGTLKLYT
jgi:hypothetical protein